ncbi:MAG: DUF6504 family protein [Nocardioides sp.]|jgi:hypothetical protein
MRRYDDPVEVRRGWVGNPTQGQEAPEQFVWRGRLWQVRAVLAHWVETGSWWSSAQVLAAIGSSSASEQSDGFDRGWGEDLLGEREFWRVEAGMGRVGGGVFDLAFDSDNGRWQLVGCVD